MRISDWSSDVCSSDLSTPKPLVVIYMILAGLGLGFVMPNLTVFAQETAGRSLLGISTAMLQSVRMIGGMLGTTIVGTLVTNYSSRRLRRTETRSAFSVCSAHGIAGASLARHTRKEPGRD